MFFDVFFHNYFLYVALEVEVKCILQILFSPFHLLLLIILSLLELEMLMNV